MTNQELVEMAIRDVDMIKLIIDAHAPLCEALITCYDQVDSHTRNLIDRLRDDGYLQYIGRLI